MGKIYSLVNQKGGVGKTTTAINLSAYIANFGYSVLLIDLDPQANATSSLGINKREVRGGSYEVLINGHNPSNFVLSNKNLGLSLLPSSPSLAGAEVELVSMPDRARRLKQALTNVSSNYDYTIIDCPPSLGLLTLNGLVASKDGIIIPVQCEYLALEGLGLLSVTLNRVRNSLFPDLKIRGLVFTMFDGRTNLANDVVQEVKNHFPGFTFDAIIPRTVRLAEAPSYGMPIYTYSPKSTGAIAYEKLAKEIILQDGGKIPTVEEQS